MQFYGNLDNIDNYETFLESIAATSKGMEAYSSLYEAARKQVLQDTFALTHEIVNAGSVSGDKTGTLVASLANGLAKLQLNKAKYAPQVESGGISSPG